jgi:S1-C subfamily serine protease
MTTFLATLGFLVLALPAYATTDTPAPEPAADRAWLGVSLQDLDDDLREAMELPKSLAGVLVPETVPGSPAREAGLKPMDVITTIDGKRVASADEVIERVGARSPGQTVSIEVWRDGAARTFTATLGSDADRREDSAFAPRDDDRHRRRHRIVIRGQGHGYLGVRTMELNEQLAGYFGVKEGEGVLVTEVLDDSPAETAGLLAGDVLVSVDGEAVDDPESLRRALRGHDSGETVEVKLLRKGEARTLSVTLAEAEDMGMFVPRAPHAPRPPRPPHAFGWHGEDFVIPMPDLRELEMHMNSDEWKEFEKDLRREMDQLREELRELRLRLKTEEKDEGE